ncbi:hypothetical protein [Shimia sp.]|uniref:hypothetical protein n=1 Tax=Shimia sp. TaxID=1954381 RepID=UPI0032973539
MAQPRGVPVKGGGMMAEHELAPTGRRVRVQVSGQWLAGDLLEQVTPKTLLPQYFAQLDSGEIRDLRNDVYTGAEQ